MSTPFQKLSRRLRICARWQFRWKVAIVAINGWLEAMTEALKSLLFGAGIMLFALTISPVLHLWHFTLGIVWSALTLSDAEIDELERRLPPGGNS